MVHVIAALCSAALAAVWGRGVCGRWWHGALLAAAMLTAPVFMSAVTSAGAALLPVPFALAWLVAVDRYDRSRHVAWLFVAGAVLGLGVHLHNSAVVLFPCFAAVTIAGFSGAIERPAPKRDLVAFCGAFAVATLPLAVAVATQSDRIREQVLAYGLYDSRRFNPLQGAREVFSWVGLSARSEAYWDYLDPLFLFNSGSVFRWPFALLLPLGVISLHSDRAPIRRLVVGGFLLVPVAGALLASPPVPLRMVLATPFAAMLAAHGVIHVPALLRRMMAGPSARSNTTRLPAGTGSTPVAS